MKKVSATSSTPVIFSAEGARFKVKDGELLGWVDQAMLNGQRGVADVIPRPFSAYVTADSSLREALDSIVTSRTQVAVVAEEGQRYRGILTLERISKEIIS